MKDHTQGVSWKMEACGRVSLL